MLVHPNKHCWCCLQSMQFALVISCNTEPLNFRFPYSVSRLSTALLPLKAVSQVELLMKVRGARYLPSSQGSQAGDAWLVAIAPVDIERLQHEPGLEIPWRAWSPLLLTAIDGGATCNVRRCRGLTCISEGIIPVGVLL